MKIPNTHLKLKNLVNYLSPLLDKVVNLVVDEFVNAAVVNEVFAMKFTLVTLFVLVELLPSLVLFT